MSKSKNPFPKEVLGVYHPWGGQSEWPVRAVENNGWYKTYRLRSEEYPYETPFQGSWRWYELKARIDQGIYAFDIPEDEDILTESVDLSEIL